ncbi:PqqD family protein [Marinomonas mediterranea]
MDIEKGFYFGLSGVSKVIWDCLESPSSIYDICSRMTTIYDVDHVKCENDVERFIKSLANRKLIREER